MINVMSVTVTLICGIVTELIFFFLSFCTKYHVQPYKIYKQKNIMFILLNS